MNTEKIKKLSEECWEARKYGPPWFDAEKFAELIVLECASICYTSGLLEGDTHARNILYEFDIDCARNQK